MGCIMGTKISRIPTQSRNIPIIKITKSTMMAITTECTDIPSKISFSSLPPPKRKNMPVSRKPF